MPTYTALPVKTPGNGKISGHNNMFTQFKGSGKEVKAYIAKSFRLRNGDKTTTVIVEKLGFLDGIAKD